MKRRFIRLSILIAGLISCSSAEKQVLIRSQPSGALVYDQTNKELGVTPLKFDDRLLSQVAQGKRLDIRLVKEGYLPKEVALNYEFYDEYEADVLQIYNQQTGRNLQLKQKRSFDKVLRFLGV